MPATRLRLLVMAQVLLTAAAASARWYHVAPDGQDAAPGTAAQPLRTIGRASALAQPGDTCSIAPGTYPERVGLKTPGSAEQPITFVAAGVVKLLGFELEQARYTRLIGFEITGSGANQPGVFLRGAHGSQILHNHLHHVGSSAIRFHPSLPSNEVVVAGNRISHTGDGGRGELAMSVCGDRNLVEYNDLSHVFDFVVVFGRRNVVRNNYWHDSFWADHPGVAPHIDGIQHYVGARYYPTPLREALIEANLMSNVPDEHTHFAMLEDEQHAGSGDLLFRRNVGWHLGGYALLIEGVRRVRIVHNTFVDLFMSSRQKAWYCIGINAGATGAQVVNNLFSGCARDGGSLYMVASDSVAGVVADHNLAFRSGSPKEAHAVIGRDPLLMAPAAGDYRLRAGSPAIDAGGSLTTTSAAGSGTRVPVTDVGCFSDGWGTVEGDRIRLGERAARVTAVDAEHRLLTIDQPLTWRRGEGVALDYTGAAPDIGAVEAGWDTTGVVRLAALPPGSPSGPMVATATVDHPEAFRHLVLFVDGVPVARAGQAPFRLAWDPTGWPSGGHRLIVRAYMRSPSRQLWVEDQATVSSG